MTVRDGRCLRTGATAKTQTSVTVTGKRVQVHPP